MRLMKRMMRMRFEFLYEIFSCREPSLADRLIFPDKDAHHADANHGGDDDDHVDDGGADAGDEHKKSPFPGICHQHL